MTHRLGTQLLVVLCGALAGCGSDGSTPAAGLVVEIGVLPLDAQRLEVAAFLDGTARQLSDDGGQAPGALLVQQKAGGTVTLGLQLSAGTLGVLAVEAKVYDGAGCQVAAGRGQGQAGQDSRIKVTLAQTLCNGTPPPPVTADLVHAWSKRYGSPGQNDSGTSVAVDGSGNVYVAGVVGGIAVDFEGTQVMPSWFRAKYRPGGKLEWAFQSGTSSFYPLIAVDNKDGSLYLAGSTASSGMVKCGDGSAYGDGQLIVAKFSPAGGCVKSKAFAVGGGFYARVLGIAVGADGVFLTGGFVGTSLDFGGGALKFAAAEDVFLAKLNKTDFTAAWAKSFGSTGGDTGYGVAVTPEGDVLLSGSFSGGVNFGGGTLFNPNSMTDAFLARYAGADGSHKWSISFGGGGNDAATAVAMDTNGNIAVAGYFDTTAAFNRGTADEKPLSAQGASGDGLVALLGDKGVYRWARALGGPMTDYGRSVVLDRGSVLVSGMFQGTADFGKGGRMSHGGQDLFLARYGLDGAWIWDGTYGGARDEDTSLFVGGFPAATGGALAVDGAGGAYVTGYSTSAVVNFGGDALNSSKADDPNSKDIFVLALKTAGP